MLRAVIFDFDGVILDTELPAYTAWCEVYASYGRTLELETWCMAVGTRDAFDPYHHLESLIQRPLDRDGIRNVRRQRESELVSESGLMPGARDRVAEAATLGLGTAIASSSDYGDVGPHLESYGILGSFQAIVCAATGGLAAKPDPALYVEALRLLDVAPYEALAFEDSRNGVAAAKAAGVTCIAVPNVITKGMDLSHADLIVPSLAEVSLASMAQEWT